MTSRAVIVIVVTLCTLPGCERGEEENIYEPGGAYIQRLDARGRRHVIQDADGKTLAKLRVKKEELRVYDAGMSPIGSARRDGRAVIVTRGGESASLKHDTPAIAELDDRLRIEAVERGWVVFDGTGSRLGYFDWQEDGRLALRDDYSSAPRLFASPDGAQARTPAGGVELTVLPPYSAATALPFALGGGLDALDRIALGLWLVAHKDDQPALIDPADAGTSTDASPVPSRSD